MDPSANLVLHVEVIQKSRSILDPNDLLVRLSDFLRSPVVGPKSLGFVDRHIKLDGAFFHADAFLSQHIESVVIEAGDDRPLADLADSHLEFHVFKLDSNGMPS